MASSLSKVPPVWPSPRPLIIGTQSPQAAARGARIRETLSPTPPVECLSTLGRPISGSSTIRPERIMASVSQLVSSAVMPLSTIAMSSALA